MNPYHKFSIQFLIHIIQHAFGHMWTLDVVRFILPARSRFTQMLDCQTYVYLGEGIYGNKHTKLIIIIYYLMKGKTYFITLIKVFLCLTLYFMQKIILSYSQLTSKTIKETMLIKYKTYIIDHLFSFFISIYQILKLLLILYMLYRYKNILQVTFLNWYIYIELFKKAIVLIYACVNDIVSDEYIWLKHTKFNTALGIQRLWYGYCRFHEENYCSIAAWSFW